MGPPRNLLTADEVHNPDVERDDAELVTRAKLGDAHAFALLYRRYVDKVYDFAAHRLESRDLAEDATQTTFTRAVASLSQCRDNALFAGWLFAIARNVVNDSYRLQRREMQLLDLIPDPIDPAATPEDLATGAAWGSELANLRERCLNESEREIFDLRLRGLSDREIAAALGRSHGAIRTAQYRMVMKMRSCLGIPVHRKDLGDVDE